MYIDDYGNRRFPDVYRAIVVDNQDPLGKGRLRLTVPQVLFDTPTDWCWGFYKFGLQTTPPTVGTGVWVSFEGGDPSYPVWMDGFDSSGSVDYLQLNTARTEGSTEVGMFTWNTEDETPEVKVGNGEVTLQVGQESHVRVYNATGTDIPENRVVYLSGGQTNAHPHVALYRADGTFSPFRVVGITTQTIPNGSDGLVTQMGKVRKVDTSAYVAGDILYASATEYGLYQTAIATAPDDIVSVATVVVADETDGEILVNVYPLINQLQTNLVFFATTAASDVSGYVKLVNSTLDPDYNTTEVNVRVPSSGYLNSTDEVLVGSLIADANEFVGNPKEVEMSTVGAIRKIHGNNSTRALFYFRVYHRTSGGTETLLGQSNKVGPAATVTLNQYEQFQTQAVVNFITFSNTDRLVIKFYADVDLNGDQAYEFRFGGISPVRTLLPVPVNVVSTPPAEDVTVSTTNFNGGLSSSDTTVQKALDTIDDLLPLIGVPSGGTANQILAKIDSTNYNTRWVEGGYRFVQRLVYTSTTAFTKASYPWLQAVKVICVGGGGAGGGTATTSSTQVALGRSGSSGGYSESFITDMSTLLTTMHGVVGAGGTGSANATGGAGSASWFGSSNSSSSGALVIANGGTGGSAGSASGSVAASSQSVAGASVGTGDLVLPGGPSTSSYAIQAGTAVGSQGGSTVFNYGFGGVGAISAAGNNATGYGGGGSGAAAGNSTGSTRAGGNGTSGIVIIELYA